MGAIQRRTNNTCSKTMSKKKSSLGVRVNFRLTEHLTNSFNELIEQGGYNRSAVIRNLVEEWVHKQTTQQGVEQ